MSDSETRLFLIMGCGKVIEKQSFEFIFQEASELMICLRRLPFARNFDAEPGVIRTV